MDQIDLPLWAEYVRALGTPTAALIAAAIASLIAYRQWLTARNKLKLDLFDRRLQIYSDAVTVLKWMTNGNWNDQTPLEKLADSAAQSRWLLDERVCMHLQELYYRAKAISQARLQDSKMQKGNTAAVFDKFSHENIAQLDEELRGLDSVFGPFLKIAH